MNVRELLTDSGHSPWFTYPEWNDLVNVADLIRDSITNPINRAAFTARAARDMEAIDPTTVEGKDFYWLLDAAGEVMPTPSGSVEIWGTATQPLFPD